MLYTSLDILYLALAAAAIILTIFLSALLIQAIIFIKDIRKISHTAGNLTENFHSLIIGPVGLASKIGEKLYPHIENYFEKLLSRKNKKQK